MPELPDVAIQERYLAEQALRRPVERTEVRDARLLAGVTPAALGRRLKGHPFTGTRRHGKHLLVRAGSGGWLALHFGMTGCLDCRAAGDPAPEYARLLLHLAGGRRLGIVSRRMLGEVAWTDDPATFVRDRELGPDLLDPDLDTGALGERIAARSRTIKSALMDQSLVAGLGNVYADETLFQAGLDPRAATDGLTPDRVREVIGVARRVARTAARHGEGNRLVVESLPRGWLLPRREEGAACPHGCGGEVRKRTVAGRPTYLCPRCQSRGN